MVVYFSPPDIFYCVSLKGCFCSCSEYLWHFEIDFPEKEGNFKVVLTWYQAKSSNGLMKGCIQHINGPLGTIKGPSTVVCENSQSSYFPGQYYCFGWNIQAFVMWIYVSFSAIDTPVKKSDQAALELTLLNSIILQLPFGSYIIRDAAYTVSDQMLVPFTGSHHQDPSKDAFNYF